jgi:hypothetical protein
MILAGHWAVIFGSWRSFLLGWRSTRALLATREGKQNLYPIPQNDICWSNETVWNWQAWHTFWNEGTDFLQTVLELEFLLQPTDSRPVRLGIGPPIGTLDYILSCSSFFVWQLLYSFFSLTRKRVCSLQCNHSLVPITIHYRLIWDCVPFMSPLTTRRDCSGGILTRLHTDL